VPAGVGEGPEVEGRQPEAQEVRAELEPRSLVHITVAVLIALAVFGLFRSARQVLTQIGIGLLLALALDPVVTAVRRRSRWSRPLAGAVVGAAALFVGLAILVVIGPPAVEQAQDFEEELPDTLQEFYRLPVVGQWLEDNDAAGRVERFIDELPATVDDETVGRTVDSLLGAAATLLIAIAVSVAVLIDGEAIVARARRLLPPATRPRADRVARILYRAFGQYFGGSVTVAVMMGVYVLVLGLAFGVPLAPIAAIWAMLTDLIPQVGGFLGGAFLALLALSVSVPIAIVVLVLFVLYMNLENHVIAPAIVGKAVDLTPPTTMVAALVGGAAAGVPGALVATPIVGAVKRLYLDFRGDGDGDELDADSNTGFVQRLRDLVRR
jgi:predicted PurR-regulated permease PerM